MKRRGDKKDMSDDSSNGDIINYDYYKKDVGYYREEFIKKIKDVNALIEILKDNGRISDKVSIEARIKSYASFCKNLEKGKNVDDCFGIRIIANNEDLTVVKKVLRKIFEIKCLKDHSKDKSTNYNAVHYTVISRNGDSITPIELQFYTPEEENRNNKGLLAHDIYKLPNGNKMPYGQAKQAVLEELARIMKLNGKELDIELPEYYEVSKDNIKKLDRRDTIKKMFPTVFYSTMRKKHEDNNMVDDKEER